MYFDLFSKKFCLLNLFYSFLHIAQNQTWGKSNFSGPIYNTLNHTAGFIQISKSTAALLELRSFL